MTETEVRRDVACGLRTAGCLAQPIESGGTSIGIPDLFARTLKTDCWCEVKIGNFSGGWVHLKWRPGQLHWLRQYDSLGGKVLLIVGFIDSDSEEALALFGWPNFLQHYAEDDFATRALDLTKLKDFDPRGLISIIDNL